MTSTTKQAIAADPRVRTDLKHGVCTACGHRGLVFLPESICTRERRRTDEHGYKAGFYFERPEACERRAARTADTPSSVQYREAA